MREIIFKKSGPRLVFSSSGQLKQLRTGSDSFAEHNDASEQLAPKLCPGYMGGPAPSEMYRVTKKELVQFVRLPADELGPVEAVLGVNVAGGHPFASPHELPVNHPSILRFLRTFHDDVAAALGYGNFAIRVRGADKVEALARFYEAILAGDVALIPSERNHYETPGVALVNLKELTESELLELNRSPQKFLEATFRN